MKALVTAAFFGLASPVFAEAPVLDGHWISAAPENMGQMYATRDFTFDGDAWSVTFRAFGDAAATVPLFTLDVGGAYRIGGASATVPGAYEGIFPATRRSITADSEAGVGLFADMGCTLSLGQAQDLVDEGCGFVPPLMQAMGEYDLVSIQGERFFFGDRSGDLTKARPTALTPFPLVKK